MEVIAQEFGLAPWLYLTGAGIVVLAALTYAALSREYGVVSLALLAPFWPPMLALAALGGAVWLYIRGVQRIARRFQPAPLPPEVAREMARLDREFPA